MSERTRDELQAGAREVGEAVTAIGYARSRVRQAADELASAHSWGTYDTWFGGGLFSSWIKHDRIADAEAAMRQVDAALETARRELADVGVGPVGDVGVEPLSRTLDIWFDNIFSDWGTQGRIKDAQARLASLDGALQQVERALQERGAALHEELRAAGG
jgi:hypothetical protein